MEKEAQDYEIKYNDFWKDIVENKDGTLNKDQVARELFDYSSLLDNVPTVYSHVTGDTLSYPSYCASSVIEAYETNLEEKYKEKYGIYVTILELVQEEELNKKQADLLLNKIGIDKEDYEWLLLDDELEQISNSLDD